MRAFLLCAAIVFSLLLALPLVQMRTGLPPDYPLAGPQVHPVAEVQAGSHLPDLLFIGDSFVFTLTNFMDRLGLYRKRDTYYYYNRQYFYPEAPNAALDKRQLDLLAELRGRDAVVIEVGEYWLPRVGFGFVRDLLKAYDALDAARAAGNAS